MIVSAWEKRRAALVAAAIKDSIARGVTGADTIAPTLTPELCAALLSNADLDPQLRLTAYGIFAGLAECEPNSPLVFGAGWSNVGGAWTPSSSYRDGVRVFVRGLVVFTPGVLTTTVGTLPPAHCPSYVVQKLVRGGLGGSCFIHIRPSGVIEFNGLLADAQASVNLDDVCSFDIRP